ncbi:MAG: pyrroline-5-carboxylate reductase [Patescibacteria group bacterium]
MEKVRSVDKKIAIIGGGHIGSALALGLVRSARVRPSQLTVSDSQVQHIAHLKKLGITVTADNVLATAHAEWVFLAVKPGSIGTVLKEIKDASKKRLIISLAAGVTIEDLRQETKSSSVSFARIMPNIPIAENQGVIGLFGSRISVRDLSQLKYVLQGLGFVLEVQKESELEILTVVSGSGPAVVAYAIEAVLTAGQTLGLSKDTATALATHTFKGTSAYLEASRMSPQQLMESVATKGGITEAILTSLKRSGVHQGFVRALKQGHLKIKKTRKA